MNRTIVAAAIFSLSLSLSGMAQSTVQTASLSAPMSAHDVHSLVKNANSRAQYEQLASYFHQQEAQYRAKAGAAMAEQDQLAQGSAGRSQKYPRPVDSAHNQYESYVAKADNAALQAQHYDMLASTPAGQNPQTASDSQGKS
jgi:hypothetical protein